MKNGRVADATVFAQFWSSWHGWVFVEKKFVVMEVLVLGWQILQFISWHLQMFCLMVVDGIQGGFVALFLEDGILHLCPIDQGLIG